MSGKRWLIWRRLRRLYAGFRHPDTPWWAKGLVILILVYGISPVDLIPDLVPFVGWLDDVSLLLLLLFARSLWQPQTLIERLARLQDPQLPAEAIRYTRRVTQVWCGFFVVNGTLALTTVLLGDMALWSLYNGLLSYLLMGTLMGGEWLLRRRLQARLATSSLEAQS